MIIMLEFDYVFNDFFYFQNKIFHSLSLSSELKEQAKYTSIL